MPTVGLEFILNSPLATSAPGGTNAARVQNDVGDLCLWSSNNVGMRITAGTGAVGVGKTAAIGVALDVSGSLHSSNVVTGPIFGTSLNGGCISDSLTLTSSAIAASAMALSNVNVVASGALQRSGGVVTGMLSCSNLSVLGSIETVNAFVTMSSNVVITNSGTGTALIVSQSGAQPVAQFSASGSTALFISSTANVGIGKVAPINFQLDVSGNVNISGAATVASIAAVTHTGTNMALTGTAQTSNLVVSGTSTLTSNVGVGKAPVAGGSYALDVSGSVNVSGTVSSSIINIILTAPGSLALQQTICTFTTNGMYFVNAYCTSYAMGGNATGWLSTAIIYKTQDTGLFMNVLTSNNMTFVVSGSTLSVYFPGGSGGSCGVTASILKMV